MGLSLVLILAILAALWLGRQWMRNLPPAKTRKIMIGGGLALLVAAGVILVASGKLAGLFAVAAGLAPWIARAMRLHGWWTVFRRMTGRAGQPRTGDTGESRPAAPDTAMTRDQAYEILGLSKGASEEEIREAHRRLMRTNHPDSGGSNWIAARLNQARDVLLG
jgi:DnaJ family protein C protein 19